MLAVLLLGLLAVLATMQYRWLGQISADERERLEKRLDTDTRRFAEDFNREIQLAYFTFQFDAEAWQGDGRFAQFNERYAAWREQAAFPHLVRDFYFLRQDSKPLRYDAKQRTFTEVEWTEDLKAAHANLLSGEDAELVNEADMTLTMPIYESAAASEKIDLKPEEKEISIGRRRETEAVTLKHPAKFGCLIIKLDEAVVKNELLPLLVRKYFSDGESGSYRLSIVSRRDEKHVLFSSATENGEIDRNSADASVPLFNLSPNNLAVFVNRGLLSRIRSSNQPPQRRLILNERIERRKIPVPVSPNGNKVNILRWEAPEGGLKSRSFERQGFEVIDSSELGGHWLLNVQHEDGSLEKFVAGARYRNLAVSFGILILLAASVAFVFLSARRAQILAQRQMDFVSAVSHEFRTPLAVIYSAGENLSDGVVDSAGQMARYGNLIKREGKKLSGMVEQILEFAGARSGRKKYDLRETDLASVIENALDECQSLIAEKGFTVEKEIAPDLPKISADSNALSHAVQNLITNAVKYGNGHQWMKISARGGGDGRIKISVEDRGIGIAPKDAANIFTPFYRAKTVVDAQIHGNGLGLSLVKQTVDAHGGKVAVESQPEKGSRFTIELPTVMRQ